MSFSYDLKKELSETEDSPRHCRVACLSAFYVFLAAPSGEGETLCLRSSNKLALLSAERLLKKLSGIAASVSEEQAAGQKRQVLTIPKNDLPELMKILKCGRTKEGLPVPDVAALTMKNCCRRAFLRGAFLSAGTISDPDRSYHLEINCKTKEQAEITSGLFHALHVETGITRKNRYESVYLKDGDGISDALGLMGARVALLELENRRILRSMRGSVNRIVNCETANIGKTAAASARQIEDILFLQRTGNLSLLDEGLDEAARIRLEYPEATLSELASMMDPPVGRSGMNHRLRKICSIANKLRAEQPDGALDEGITAGKRV